jgi:dihydroorotase (multifunctional complex type)
VPIDLILYNGKINIHDTFTTAGIGIDEGRIVKIAKKTNLPPASERVDLEGRFVLPGLIDVHTHLRDQRQAYEEDFLSGTAAAAAGGVTLCLDMPNNEPVTMSPGSLDERMQRAVGRILANVGFYSAFPEDSDKISQLVKLGAVAFKLFMTKQVGGANIDSDGSLEQAFWQTKQSDVPVAVHAEDKASIERIEEELKRVKKNDIAAYLQAHSPTAEEKAVKRILRLVEKTRARVHLCHISSKLGLDAVMDGKKRGLPISCEVTTHHLLMSYADLTRQGTIALCDPPLRSQEDIEALWEALRKGFIDIVASDHAPHLLAEKKAESVWEVKPGFPSLEIIVPLILTQINRGRLSIEDLARLMAEKPAEVFHLNERGRLENGYKADVTIVDMHREYKIDASKFYSKAKYSPFDGCRAKGKPVKTYVNGQLVMEDGEIVAKPGSGEVIGWAR